MIRFLASAVVLAFAALASGDPAWVIPGGMDAEVQEFIAPLALGHEAAPGCVLDGISIESNRIRLKFRVGPGARDVEVDVLYADQVQLDIPTDAPAPLAAALRENFAKPRAKVPWVRPGESDFVSHRAAVAAGKPWSAAADWRSPFLWLGWFVLALLIIATALELRGKPPVSALLALAALTTIGGALRHWISPHTLLHEYYHSEMIEQYLYGGTGDRLSGSIGPSLYRLGNALIGGEENAVFATNVLIATLTIPAVAMLALALFGQWTRALMAAFTLAVLPVHLRFSACEDLSIPATLFGVWGIAAFVRWCTTGRTSALIAATCAVLLAISARPEMVILPLFLLAYYLAHPERRSEGPKSKDALISAIPVIAFAIYRSVRLVQDSTASTTPGFSPFRSLTSWKLIALFDPVIMPPFIWLLLGIGAFALLRSPERSKGIWLLGATLALATAPLALYQNAPPSNLRLQMLSMPLAAIICASALTLFTRQLPWTIAAAILLTLGLKSRLPAIQATSDQQQEWQFLRETIPTLPANSSELLTITGEPARLDPFPRFLLRGKQSVIALRDIDRGEWPEAKPGLLYYQGMYCYFSAFPDRCRVVRERYSLTPIATRTIPGPPYSNLAMAAPPYTIGFYELHPK